MTKHLLSLGLLLLGGSLAFAGTVHLRGHHPVVNPHSQTESTVTFIFWLVVVITFIGFPVFLGYRFSRLPFPTALRIVAWLTFFTIGFYLWRTARPILVVPYVTGIGCGYLFASDAIRSFRTRSWAMALPAALAWLPSAGAFLALASALLYLE